MIIDPYNWNSCTVQSIKPAAVDTIAVELVRPQDYMFQAGQYTVVRVTNEAGESFMRQYSFSSAPDEDTLEFLVQHEPEGVVSGWFFDTAKPGTSIEISQPFGSFTLGGVSPSRHILLIAGRVGIAPFFSMMRARSHENISVVYSVRAKDQVCFPALLKAYKATIIQTDRAPRISEAFPSEALRDKPLIYLCGSKRFVDSVASTLIEQGVSASDIKRELFTLQ